MSDDRSTVTIPHHGFAVIVDAVQRAVLDKGASKATRKAAFSAITGTGRRGIDHRGDVAWFPGEGRPRADARRHEAAPHGLSISDQVDRSPSCHRPV